MYAQVSKQILGSSITEDWIARHLFIDLFLICDEDGVVDMTPQAIARRTNMPLELVVEKLEWLCQPDPQSRAQTEGGRRLVLLDEHRDWGWRIVNHDLYRKRHRGHDKRVADRERIAEKRRQAKAERERSQTDSRAAPAPTASVQPEAQKAPESQPCREVSHAVSGHDEGPSSAPSDSGNSPTVASCREVSPDVANRREGLRQGGENPKSLMALHASEDSQKRIQKNPPLPPRCAGGGVLVDSGSETGNPTKRRRRNAPPTDTDPVFDAHDLGLTALRELQGQIRRPHRRLAKRRRLVAQAIRDYGADVVRLAARNLPLSPHHRGDNERATEYLEIHLALRNVERFANLCPGDDDAFRQALQASLQASRRAKEPEFVSPYTRI